MNIKLRLYALTRDYVGQNYVSIELEQNATVDALRKTLTNAYPSLKPLQSHLLFATGKQYLDDQDILTEGQELACFPPVSGG